MRDREKQEKFELGARIATEAAQYESEQNRKKQEQLERNQKYQSEVKQQNEARSRLLQFIGSKCMSSAQEWFDASKPYRI